MKGRLKVEHAFRRPFHSRPKAAGVPGSYVFYRDEVSTRSHAKAAGRCKSCNISAPCWFQLAATRRRLAD